MFKLFPISGGVCAAKGFYADGKNCGLKSEGNDLSYIHSKTLCNVAGVFTTNAFCAAPVVDAKAKILKPSNGIIINSKNANAMTGTKGVEDLNEILSHVPFENPFMSSTGVIGEFLPKEKIIKGLSAFDFEQTEPSAAAQGIMTTDRWEKSIAYQVVLENGEVFNIGAMAKGAGMIAPNMATMLCFVTTDAKIERDLLQKHLDAVSGTTFNAVTVDGDMSTNDSVFVFANGESGAYEKSAFGEALRMVMHEMALQLVKDGEGATKLVAFEVKGAVSDSDAQVAAKALANSLLVKTALFGQDPNWGRLAMAVGASGVACDESTLVIQIGNVTLYERGVNMMCDEVETNAAKVMQMDEFRVTIDLGLGEGMYRAYGCDLGHEYVTINADYRT
jgi:glutamate N-acetyltransferase / amino-acid N-acetyltransferase